MRTALACEAVFGIPVSELFAGMHDRADRQIGKRLLELRSKLQANSGQKVKASEARLKEQKLRWLDAHVGGEAVEENTKS